MTLRIGLLGAGWFGREAHLKNLLTIPDVEVAAVSSRSESSRQAASELIGNSVRTFADWRALIQHAGVDAVIIALPNHEHCAAAVAAFQAGLHVLCEKPLGISMTECNAIIAASEEAGRVLQIGHEMRFQKLYRTLHEMVTDGQIGDPRLMWCREYRGRMRPGWRSSRELTGGLMLEKNCHHFDLFNWIMPERAIRVAAMCGTDVLSDTELPDNAQVIVEFEGSRRATLEVCLFAPQGGECEIGIVGTEGRIDTQNQALRMTVHRFEPPETRAQTIPEDDEEVGFVDGSGRVDRGIRAQLVEFTECCGTGDIPLNNGQEARHTVAVCLAAEASMQRGEFAELQEFLG